MPHPHAENMRLYAEDAAEIDTPWERWEFCYVKHATWVTCTSNPEWSLATTYRRKPKTRTYTVTVPMPLKEWQEGCFTINSHGVFEVLFCINMKTTICWATQAEAQQAYEALFGPLKS